MATDGSKGLAASGNLAYALQQAREVVQLPKLKRTDVVAVLSAAFDLAESQPAGHAVRVAYLSKRIADELELEPAAIARVVAAGLLHDAGIAVRSTPDDTSNPGGHTAVGAWVAAQFGYDRSVQEAIRASHERWDGTGRPRGLAAEAIPVTALIVSAAHWASDEADGFENLLRARSKLRQPIGTLLPIMGPRVAEALESVLHADQTWIDLSSGDLALHLDVEDGEPSASNVADAARVFGRIVDAAAREEGRSDRVAAIAVELGRQAGMPAAMLEALFVAGQLADLGLLGVPRHITDKPAILTVPEMETMQRHTSSGALIVEDLPGLEAVARWIEAHHERIDGRGYPEMLEADEIPLPARILAVADSYCALRSERPYRPAFGATEAMGIIESGAGTQFDPAVASMLPDALRAVAATSEASKAS
ncbi:MAG: HD domain-containing protein [Dehalococcoidia bacterium]|nr:HD domain-containing protein [Dehalococcoidia bacterium]